MWRVLFARPRAIDADAVARAIVARLDALVGELSHWAADSRLSAFNRAAAGTWISLPSDFAHVIAAALRIAEESGGAFDPAIGRLVNLWGYGPPGRAAAPPDDAAIDALLATSNWRRLAFDADAGRLRQPGGVSLDLSGIAKGHAVDAVAGVLRAAGVRHFLAEIGGELVGHGIRPDGDPWWVDLEQPPGVTLPRLRVALHGLAVATSGNYRRGDHNLDPRTGRMPAGGVVSASVIHATAMEADAWATALTVLGPDAGIAAAERAGLAARIVTSGAGERLSPALMAMLSG